mmetsp:Transcript_25512/g.59779  ORF Transcript_25512/g.59779 Transcript_25512/m.59779 type:complete len:694 (+) Transcript_25512:38-2119(+)
MFYISTFLYAGDRLVLLHRGEARFQPHDLVWVGLRRGAPRPLRFVSSREDGHVRETPAAHAPGGAGSVRRLVSRNRTEARTRGFRETRWRRSSLPLPPPQRCLRRSGRFGAIAAVFFRRAARAASRRLRRRRGGGGRRRGRRRRRHEGLALLLGEGRDRHPRTDLAVAEAAVVSHDCARSHQGVLQGALLAEDGPVHDHRPVEAALVADGAVPAHRRRLHGDLRALSAPGSDQGLELSVALGSLRDPEAYAAAFGGARVRDGLLAGEEIRRHRVGPKGGLRREDDRRHHVGFVVEFLGRPTGGGRVVVIGVVFGVGPALQGRHGGPAERGSLAAVLPGDQEGKEVLLEGRKLPGLSRHDQAPDPGSEGVDVDVAPLGPDHDPLGTSAAAATPEPRLGNHQLGGRARHVLVGLDVQLRLFEDDPGQRPLAGAIPAAALEPRFRRRSRGRLREGQADVLDVFLVARQAAFFGLGGFLQRKPVLVRFQDVHQDGRAGHGLRGRPDQRVEEVVRSVFAAAVVVVEDHQVSRYHHHPGRRMDQAGGLDRPDRVDRSLRVRRQRHQVEALVPSSLLPVRFQLPAAPVDVVVVVVVARTLHERRRGRFSVVTFFRRQRPQRPVVVVVRHGDHDLSHRMRQGVQKPRDRRDPGHGKQVLRGVGGRHGKEPASPRRRQDHGARPGMRLEPRRRHRFVSFRCM